MQELRASQGDQAVIVDRLRTAVGGGDVVALAAMLTDHPGLVSTALRLDGPDAADARGTLLHLAAAEGQSGAARLLVERGAPVDARSSEGRTALHYAFARGGNDILEMLILAGAEIDVCIAAACGLHGRLRDILSADVSKVDDLTTGITPMMWARYGRQTGSMRLLAELGASDQSVLAETSVVTEAEQDRIAAKMLQLTVELDELRAVVPAHKQARSPRLGTCHIAIDSQRRGFRELRANCAHFCGRPADMARDGIADLAALYAAEGVERFFVSLSPGPRLEQMRQQLANAGFHCRGAAQAVLRRDARPPAPIATEFSLREAMPDEVHALGAELRGILWPEGHANYVATAGRPGFFHYIAYAGETPAATGVLHVNGDFGCLMLAATAPPFRGRGGQQALISHRIAKARELGCMTLVSETEQVLVPSYRNLRQAGFSLAYEKQIFSWNPIAP